MKGRILAVAFIFSLAFASLVFQLYEIQIVKNSFFSARAESQIKLSGYLEAKRGGIYFTDREGNLIQAASNKDYTIVFASPKQIVSREEAAAALAPILNIDEKELAQRFSKKTSYELLASKITEGQADKIRSLRLKGIFIDTKEFRFYPFGNLAANVLGFVGPSSKDSQIRGRYGIEAFYDERLNGKAGVLEKDKVIDPDQGEDIVLTIDRFIQSQAEEILEKAVANNKASGGTIIVQEPATGKILALANLPSFDPDNYSSYKLGDFINPAVQAIYEPGSVFKVITMAAGIDSGKLTPETEFNDTGSFVLNNRTLTNYQNKAYGKVTMKDVIANSINTGAVFVVRKIGHDTFFNYAIKFGFDDKTGIDLPGELRGDFRRLKNNPKDINFATASFGQGLAVTPIQLINAVSAIANGGELMKAYITEDSKTERIRRVVKPETAALVRDMMVGAVKKAGAIQIPGYAIAGKTGTAAIPDFKKGGYTDEFVHTFAGFAPAAKPRFTILVKIDSPQVGPLAGFTVVPAFAELAQFALNYYGVSPDDIQP